MENENKPIEVFAKVNNDGFITEIASSVFLKNIIGWKKIDEGFGDKYVHAQTMYFPTSLIDYFGNFIYKI